VLLRAAQVIGNSRNRLRPGSLSGSFPLEGKMCYFAQAQNNNWFVVLIPYRKNTYTKKRPAGA
jgi:hypothetical protein